MININNSWPALSCANYRGGLTLGFFDEPLFSSRTSTRNYGGIDCNVSSVLHSYPEVYVDGMAGFTNFLVPLSSHLLLLRFKSDKIYLNTLI